MTTVVTHALTYLIVRAQILRYRVGRQVHQRRLARDRFNSVSQRARKHQLAMHWPSTQVLSGSADETTAFSSCNATGAYRCTGMGM